MEDYIDILAKRILRRVIQEGECIVWQGARNKSGEGVIKYAQRIHSVHRVIYAWHFNGVPDGADIMHTCENLHCVNSAHLWASNKHSSDIGELAKRVLANTKPQGACLIWQGGCNSLGYGRIRSFEDGKYTYHGTHRVIYAYYHHGIPEGLDVCHACDTPACVNIDHLWVGDQRANSQDAARKGRTNAGERHPMHKLSWDTIHAIRAQWASAQQSGQSLYGVQTAIAKAFGLSLERVNRIVNGRNWKGN